MLLAICTLVPWAGVTGKHTFDSAPEGSRWGRRAGEQNGENRANGGRWQGAPTERALILFIKGPQLEHLKLVIWLRGLRPSPPRRRPPPPPPLQLRAAHLEGWSFSVMGSFAAWPGWGHYDVSPLNWDSRCLSMHLWKMFAAQSLHQDTCGQGRREIESYY